MNPPSVYELTSPSTHSTSSTIARVQSITTSLSNLEPGIARSSGGDQIEERRGCVAERTGLRVQEADLPLDVQLLHRHLAEDAGLDVLAHAHARQERDALAVLDQPSD